MVDLGCWMDERGRILAYDVPMVSHAKAAKKRAKLRKKVFDTEWPQMFSGEATAIGN
ncbi:MAG: hypothetical protein J6386_20395 [Candidatus Synoicihabitans palmerolidicus]|nr:hypothetical protein [Candidatus Synoicihabitans palmerolidicus]